MSAPSSAPSPAPTYAPEIIRFNVSTALSGLDAAAFNSEPSSQRQFLEAVADITAEALTSLCCTSATATATGPGSGFVRRLSSHRSSGDQPTSLRRSASSIVGRLTVQAASSVTLSVTKVLTYPPGTDVAAAKAKVVTDFTNAIEQAIASNMFLAKLAAASSGSGSALASVTDASSVTATDVEVVGLAGNPTRLPTVWPSESPTRAPSEQSQQQQQQQQSSDGGSITILGVVVGSGATMVIFVCFIASYWGISRFSKPNRVVRPLGDIEESTSSSVQNDEESIGRIGGLLEDGKGQVRRAEPVPPSAKHGSETARKGSTMIGDSTQASLAAPERPTARKSSTSVSQPQRASELTTAVRLTSDSLNLTAQSGHGDARATSQRGSVHGAPGVRAGESLAKFKKLEDASRSSTSSSSSSSASSLSFGAFDESDDDSNDSSSSGTASSVSYCED